MTTLRLFHRNDPFRQIEAREFAGGELTIGRGPTVGWAIDDPSRTLSRQHCVIAQAGDELVVRDMSANGVFLGRDRTRVPRGTPTPLTVETFHLGEFLIVIEPGAKDAPASLPEAAAPLADRPAPPGETAAPSAGALLESFCEGARLNVSAFSDDDPSDVLRRLGETYRQMVAGLVALMAERTQVRREHWIDRTAVRAEGNNPFRWGQANRVAIDLLRDGGPGFLVGAAAVEASFSDLIQHQQSVSAATIESIAAVLRAFSPGAIEAGSRGRSMLEPKAAACWSGFLREHQKLRSLADEDPKSLLGKAFRSACEQSGSELASRQSA